MDQSLAVWILIALALVTANLPFLSERPFLVLPWEQAGEPARPSWLRWIETAVFLALLVGLAYAALALIGNAFLVGSGLGSVMLLLAKVLGIFLVAAVLLSYPGWRNRGRPVRKSFPERLIEVIAFYGLVGTLGRAFESNIGNPFSQKWEFYAITFCLFLVLAYPGFVYRYLMRRRKA